MTENTSLKKQTEQQQEVLAKTIATKKGFSLMVGLEELLRTFNININKKPKNKNKYQISKDLEEIDEKIGKNRPPILID